MLTKCGLDCEKCDFKAGCEGCETIKGKVFWTSDFGVEVCPMYACCDSKGYRHCGYCEQMPCEVHKGNKDPSMSDEAHMESIMARTKLMKEDAARG